MKSFSIAAKQFAVIFLALVFVLAPVQANAQALKASPASVALSYSVGETISIAPSTGTATFDPASLTTPTYTVTTSWTLLPTRTTVNINFGLQSASAALANGTSNIPSSNVFMALNGGSYNNCTQSSAADATLTAALTAGAICNAGVLVPITTANDSGNRVTSFTLQLQNLPITLAAGVYTGTLLIVADAV